MQFTPQGERRDSLVAISAIETRLESDTLRAGGLLPLILQRANRKWDTGTADGQHFL